MTERIFMILKVLNVVNHVQNTDKWFRHELREWGVVLKNVPQ